MKINLHSSPEDVQIQILPLIDVVFCILTFFLLAALQFSRQQVVGANIGSSGSGATGGPQIALSINELGQISVENDNERSIIQEQEIEQKLKQYLEKNPQGIVVFKAPRTASYDNVINFLQRLQNIGGNRVRLGYETGVNPSIPGSSSPLPGTGLPINPGGVPAPGLNPQQGNQNFNLPPGFPSGLPSGVGFPDDTIPDPGNPGINANPGVSPATGTPQRTPRLTTPGAAGVKTPQAIPQTPQSNP